MNAGYQEKIREYVTGFHLPRYRELPDIGLRLEQVVRYVNRYAPSPITGSMVSNYVKQKLIPGPDKKSYGPETIAYLIFVAYVKAVVSMDDIRLLMDVQRDSYSLSVAYDYFCDEFENLLQFFCGLKQMPDRVGHDDTAEKELLRTALLSITYKVYLDQHLRMIREDLEKAPTAEEPS